MGFKEFPKLLIKCIGGDKEWIYSILFAEYAL